jgi:hypothetical protein
LKNSCKISGNHQIAPILQHGDKSYQAGPSILISINNNENSTFKHGMQNAPAD